MHWSSIKYVRNLVLTTADYAWLLQLQSCVTHLTILQASTLRLERSMEWVRLLVNSPLFLIYFGTERFVMSNCTVYSTRSYNDPAVGPDQFRRDLKLKTHLFEWHCVSFSALAVFSRNTLYKSTFYLLTYLLTRQAASAAYAVLRCMSQAEII